MTSPTELEVNQLLHFIRTTYDQAKVHEYYIQTRKLKGRAEASNPERTQTKRSPDVRAGQRQKLNHQILTLEDKSKKLEDLIRKREREEASENRKSKAKKERARKESDKPKTLVERVEIVHERDSSTSSMPKQSVSDLKTLAIRVRGQIVVAKQKLAAL